MSFLLLPGLRVDDRPNSSPTRVIQRPNHSAPKRMMRRKKLSGPSVNYLPMEMVSEVLSRLPVKSLLRFRCVCESWDSLISSTEFAYLHLAHHRNNDDDDHDDDNNGDDDETPILTYNYCNPSDRWNLRPPTSFRKIMGGNCRRQSHRFSNYPETHNPRLNSVNGLLLLHKVNTSHADLQKTDLMLWNPILRKTHKLPTLGFPSSTLGFGFSPSENDHKVIAITKRPSLSVHLYKHSIGTWSSIVDYRANAVQGTDSRGVLIKGAIFWASGYGTSSVLISFDVKNEVFDYITLPTDTTCRRVDPVAYRKWVGLLDYDGLTNYSCSLWVLNDDADKMARNWNKLYTVVLDELHIPDYLCWTRSGKIIFATREEGVSMADMEAQTVKHLLKGRSFVYHKQSIALTYCTSFKESLMLL